MRDTTLAAVIKSEPAWNSLLPNLHPRIRLMLERCLKKEPKNRYHDIADVRVDIHEVLTDPSGVFVQPSVIAKSRSTLLSRLTWVVAAIVITAIVAGLVGWNLKRPELLRLHFDYDLPEDQLLTGFGLAPFAVSPDDKQIVYTSDGGLYLLSLEKGTTVRLVGIEEEPRQPFFSPDGQWIVYYSQANAALKKVAIIGSTPSKLCDSTLTTGGARWYQDNSIIFSTLNGIMRISSDGGTPETLVERDSLPEPPFFPQLLPDGKSLLFTIGHDLQPEGSQMVVVQSLESGDRKELFRGVKAARYLPTGHLVYRMENSLFAVPFDPETLEKTGSSFSVVNDVAEYTVSDSGMLVYIAEKAFTLGGGARRTLVWVDRDGGEEQLEVKPDSYFFPRISPDGTKVALVIGNELSASIWTLDLISKIPDRLTYDETTDLHPIWTPDSKRTVFFSFRGGEAGIYSKSADGIGDTEIIASALDRVIFPSSWSHDRKTLILKSLVSDMSMITFIPIIEAQIKSPNIPGRIIPGQEMDILSLPVEGDKKLKLLLASDKYFETGAQISPDGQWIAYASNNSGQYQIYVRPYPEVGSGGPWLVSTSGGEYPLWSPDGKELFYRIGNTIMGIPIEPGVIFKKKGRPQELFQGNYVAFTGGGMWDIHPETKRFLMLKEGTTTNEESAATTGNRISIVLNWFEDLKDRVPVD